MPRNDDHDRRSPGLRGPATSADDFIAQLVGEIVDSAGGKVGDTDGELATIERHLAELREREESPTPPAEPVRPTKAALPAPSTVRPERPVEPVTKPAQRPVTNTMPARRPMTSEERLAALKALSDELTAAETAVRSESRAVAVPPASEVRPEPRSPAPKPAAPDVDDVIVDAAKAAGTGIAYAKKVQHETPPRRSPLLTTALSMLIVLLSGLLALSWWSPSGARGLVDGSAWRQASVMLGGADDIAVQTTAVADLSCEPAGALTADTAALPQSALAEPAVAAEALADVRTPLVEPLSHGLRVVKTVRVGPDGRVQVPSGGVPVGIPSRQALAEHSASN